MDETKEIIAIGEVEPGTRLTRFRDLILVANPDHPLRYIDRKEPLAGIRDLPSILPD